MHFKAILLFITLFTGPSAAPAALPPVITLPAQSSELDSVAYDARLKSFQCSDDPCRFWIAYKLAVLHQSCDEFLKITDKSHPTYPLMLIKEARFCTGERAKDTLKNIEDYVKTDHARLKTDLATAQAAAALEANSTEKLLDVIPLIRTKQMKVQFLEEALEKTQGPLVEQVRAELEKISPELSISKQKDWRQLAIESMNNHDYPNAIKAFSRVIASKTYSYPVKRTALELLKQCFKAVEKKKEAMQTAMKLWLWDKAFFIRAKSPSQAQRLLSSGLALARFQWTQHRDQKALETLQKTEKAVRGYAGLSELYYLRARIFEERESYGQALEALTSALKSSHDSVFLNNTTWFAAWLNIKMGNNKESAELLGQLAPTEEEPGRRAQDLFWRAKSLQALGDSEHARSEFENVIGVDPIGYYALVSYRELARPIPRPDRSPLFDFSKIPRKLPSQREDSDRDNLFNWLVSLGEFDLAKSLLDSEVPVSDTSTDWETTFIQYARATHFNPIFTKITKLSAPEKIKILSEYPDALFPQLYKDEVSEASRQTGLWPEFIFSIIRQESSFDAGSVSPANAYGLMQILPRIAKEVQHEPVDTAALLDPEINIRLGAKHLRRYWDQFNGQFVFASAAYNASPDAVHRWIESRYRGDMLKFIEEIPYEETRTYVKLVLRNFVNYLRINSENNSIKFPEWTLDGPQPYNEGVE